MSAENNQQLNPRAALDQARRVEDTIRRKGRWHGWSWLIIAILTPVFLIGAGADDVLPAPTQFWIAIGFMIVGGTLAIMETRRGVWTQEAVRADRPFTWVYMVAIALVALVHIFGDISGLPWWYVGLAVLPSVPCLIASWRIFSR